MNKPMNNRLFELGSENLRNFQRNDSSWTNNSNYDQVLTPNNNLNKSLSFNGYSNIPQTNHQQHQMINQDYFQNNNICSTMRLIDICLKKVFKNYASRKLI